MLLGEWLSDRFLQVGVHCVLQRRQIHTVSEVAVIYRLLILLVEVYFARFIETAPLAAHVYRAMLVGGIRMVFLEAFFIRTVLVFFVLKDGQVELQIIRHFFWRLLF